MRMSLSRFAALAAALLAGVTLESCASSSAFVAASGPNPQPFSVNAARVRFIQGSPDLNVGVTTVDLYIDNRFAGTFPYGAVSPDVYSLPAGVHDFRLVQHGTLAPVFLDKQFTLTAGTKYAVVAAGDAGEAALCPPVASPTRTCLMLFVEPKYNTAAGNTAVSVFNASPRAGFVDFRANGFDLATDTVVGLFLSVGSPAAPPASWKLNVAITPPGPEMCISAYSAGTTTPLVGGWPTAASDEHLDLNCTATLPPSPPTTPVPSPNLNLYLIEFGASPATTSLIVTIFDQNG